MSGTILRPVGMLTKETYDFHPTEPYVWLGGQFVLETKRSVSDQGVRVMPQTLRLWNEVWCKWSGCKWILNKEARGEEGQSMEKTTFSSTCLLNHFSEHTSKIFGYPINPQFLRSQFYNLWLENFIQMKSQPEIQLINQWKHVALTEIS